MGKSGLLEHKSGNISETSKDRGKLQWIGGPIGSRQRSFERYHPDPIRPPLPQDWGSQVATPIQNLQIAIIS